MRVQYIGHKALKKDNVAGTGVIWMGHGDIQEVQDAAWPKLAVHADVWAIPGTVTLKPPAMGVAEEDGPTFEDYLRFEGERGAIDFALRFSFGVMPAVGGLEFYVHPANRDGATLSFMVHGNRLSLVRNGAEQELLPASLSGLVNTDAPRSLDEARVTETKTYADGTTATGVAPLPDASPTAVAPPADQPAAPATAFALQHADGSTLQLASLDDKALKAFAKEHDLAIDLRVIRGGDPLRQAIVDAVKAASDQE